MKRFIYPSILANILIATPVGAQSAADHKTHHLEREAPPAALAEDEPRKNRLPMDEMDMSACGRLLYVDHIEGRIAFLRAELKITDGQTGAWSAFADALRANAQKLGETHVSIGRDKRANAQETATIAQRLDARDRLLTVQLDGVRAIKSAYADLESVLSDEQRKSAEELLASPMGMGGMEMRMKGMMGGRAPSDQMP